VAVIAWVGYLLVGQTIMKKYKPLTIVFYDFLQVFIYVSLLQSPATTISQLTTHNLLAILYIAIVASYIAYLCYWTAIKYIGASNAGVGELCFGSFLCSNNCLFLFGYITINISTIRFGITFRWYLFDS